MAENRGQIYELIGKAIGKIGAIGKDKKNAQQGFMYRGIDQVYNALNPVMAELGIFFCPEVLEQKREERMTKNGSILTYTILTMRYTAYAPDGSSVSMTVVGEGMDSGDKGSNKAMSVAMKYAMFQLFCIPTEEMKDPDADVYKDIMPRGTPVQTANVRPQSAPAAASMTTVSKAPPIAPQAPATPPAAPQAAPETPGAYLQRMIKMQQQTYAAYGYNFMEARAGLIQAGLAQDVPSATMTMEQAKSLIQEIGFFYDERKRKAEEEQQKAAG